MDAGNAWMPKEKGPRTKGADRPRTKPARKQGDPRDHKPTKEPQTSRKDPKTPKSTRTPPERHRVRSHAAPETERERENPNRNQTKFIFEHDLEQAP